jgi:soluble lytic murein transglycosylase
VCAALLLGCSESPRPAAAPEKKAEPAVPRLQLLDLYRAAAAKPGETVHAGASAIEERDPEWPVVRYLEGESLLHAGRSGDARESFRALAAWAASTYPQGPYGDTWGGSALAVAGLWRWLQVMDREGAKDPQEVDDALRIAAALAETRLYGGMTRSPLLPALPQLEEDSKRLLAHVAWKARKPEAGALFLDFLTVSSGGRLDAIDEEIRQSLLRSGTVVEHRLDLFRARRQLALVRTEERRKQAQESLKRIWNDAGAPADVRAEAGYEWANSRRGQKEDKAEVIAVLTGVLELAPAGPVADRALFRRGTVYNADAPSGRDFAAFRDDMLRLLADFPKSGLADDALWQLANEYLFRSELDTALEYYAKLRDFTGPNDFKDSAYFLPALGLIGRGAEPDLDAADALLAKYVGDDGDAVFAMRCRFWRARIAELRGRGEQARALFEETIRRAPYDYYAIRARMHLEEGTAAKNQPLPAAGSKTRTALAEAFRASRVDTALKGTTAYHERLAAAVSGGLYRELLQATGKLEERFDTIELAQLEHMHLLPAVVLLIALRQDALAARDAEPTTDKWFRLAGLVGKVARDWPAMLEIMTAYGRSERLRLAEMQGDARYLATLYPTPQELGLAELLGSAAWPVGGDTGLSQSLMYAIMRQESRFYTKAVSPAGATGLFQIIPPLFDDLNKRWRLLEDGGSRTLYLADPAKSMRLWARWAQADLALKDRNQAAYVLMRHQAGVGNVRKWESYWKKLADPADLEMKIETARFNETRNFARLALRDAAIVDAAVFPQER